MKLRSTRKDRSFLNYTIIKQIGEGAFANVFLAKHKQSQDLFAVKVLDKRQLLGNGQLRYAYSEIDILERVKHPFVI
jgi:serine/threonine protein kinase